MESGDGNGTRLDLVLLLLALALFLFASPFTAWWAGAGLPWYAPFALWARVIAGVAWQRWIEGGHDA